MASGGSMGRSRGHSCNADFDFAVCTLGLACDKVICDNDE